MPRAPGRIEDTGEKLGGARKDDFAGDAGTNSQLLRANDLPLLETLWPKPADWRDWCAFMEPERVVFNLVIRGNLASKPHADGYHGRFAEFWESNYRTSLSVLMAVLADPALPLDLDELASAYNHRLGYYHSTRDRVAFHKALSIGRGGTRTLQHPFSLTAIDTMRANYLVAMGWPDNPAVSDNLAFGALEFRSKTGTTMHWRAVQGKSGNGWVALSATKHAIEADAVTEARLHVEKMLSEKKGGPVKKARPWAWTRTPVPDAELTRNGSTTNSRGRTAGELIERYGFRGLEFGNWIPQAERQDLVDMTYDAMIDLVTITGMPDRFASLGGRLGLGFGSRGKGLSAAAAHFEPGKWIVHLSRKQGAGAFAHEFGHALDHFIAVRNWKPAPDAIEWEQFASCRSGIYKTSDAPIGEVMNEIFRNIGQEKHNSLGDFYMGACSMDQHQKKRYWATEPELFARAFETFAMDKLAASGFRGNYLVYGVDEAGQLDRMKNHHPIVYPVGLERLQLVGLMQRLMDECRTAWRSSARIPASNG